MSVVSLNVIGGGALFEPVVGWLLDLHWDGTKINQVPFYSVSNYHFAFIVLPIGFILALLLLIFMKETFAKQKRLQ